MRVDARLEAYAATVDARLDQLLPAADSAPAELHEAMRYSCLAPGKRLRPALCMGSCEAVGGTSGDALDAACAVEMVHCFSLIHDDLPAIDNDDLRRGRASCHKEFGEAIAILAGDALFSLAFEVLAHAGADGGVDDLAVLRAVRILTRATGSNGLVGGEVVDVLSEGMPVEAQRLEYIHSRKTGALMAAACRIGAILGNGSDEQVSDLGRFGEKLGLAFQIADDILNETADPALLGKGVGTDRERSKATYTALYGLGESRRLALETASKAKATIQSVADPGFLRELADFAVGRLH